MKMDIKKLFMALVLIPIMMLPFYIIARYFLSNITLEMSIMIIILIVVIISLLIMALLWVRKKEVIMDDERSELLDFFAMRNSFIFYTISLPYFMAIYITNKNVVEPNVIIIITILYTMSWIVYILSRIYYNYTH